MKTLYHATTAELRMSHRLDPVVTNIAAITDPLRFRVETLLDQRRPKYKPSRLSSWFACDEPYLAAKYLDAEIEYGRAQLVPGGRHLYALEMGSPSKHPMILVNKIAAKLSEGKTDGATILADEYWEPKQDWRFWEYLLPEITITADLSWPDAIALSQALQTYMGDYDVFDRLVNALKL